MIIYGKSNTPYIIPEIVQKMVEKSTHTDMTLIPSVRWGAAHGLFLGLPVLFLAQFLFLTRGQNVLEKIILRKISLVEVGIFF